MEKKTRIEFEIAHFDTPQEKKQAQSIVRTEGLQEFNSMAFQYLRIPSGKYFLENEHIFSNQYNATHLETGKSYRVFEYAECLTNPTGRSSVRPLGYGYYISNGVKLIREYQAHLKKCGYCGRLYFDTRRKFCCKCAGSEYLKEEDLYLLQLQPISPIIEPPKKTAVPYNLIEYYQIRQKTERTKRAKKELADAKRRVKRDLEAAKIEAKGKLWVIAKGLPINNLIYYGHSNTFCFGWREKIGASEAFKIHKIMEGFPYKYTIKQ